MRTFILPICQLTDLFVCAAATARIIGPERQIDAIKGELVLTCRFKPSQSVNGKVIVCNSFPLGSRKPARDLRHIINTCFLSLV